MGGGVGAGEGPRCCFWSPSIGSPDSFGKEADDDDDGILEGSGSSFGVFNYNEGE